MSCHPAMNESELLEYKTPLFSKFRRKILVSKLKFFFGQTGLCVDVHSKEKEEVEIWLEYSCVDPLGYFIHNSTDRVLVSDFKLPSNIYYLSTTSTINITGIQVEKLYDVAKLQFVDKTRKYLLADYLSIPSNLVSKFCSILHAGMMQSKSISEQLKT